MFQPVIMVLRQALYLFGLTLAMVFLQVKWSGLPFAFSRRFFSIYYTACLVVVAGYQALKYLDGERNDNTTPEEPVFKK